MQKRKLIMLTTFFILVGTQACRWQDDFRTRDQPYYLGQPQYIQPIPRPTLNKDSEDYEGDDLNRQAEIEKNTPMPNIDALSKIPEVPQYPAGVDVR